MIVLFPPPCYFPGGSEPFVCSSEREGMFEMQLWDCVSRGSVLFVSLCLLHAVQRITRLSGTKMD